MCGIAGYSFTSTSRVDRTLAAQALLAGIAERGADAVGYAWRAPGRSVVVHKQQTGASQLIARIAIGADATEALVHVRAHTKGPPRVFENNHPIRHGAVVGIHNGTIENDDAIFERLGRDRHRPEMSVDSEAVFALAHATESAPQAMEQLQGSLAAAWLDERQPGTLYLARGSGRPLWLGLTPSELFFASTRLGLVLLARTIEHRLELAELEEGTALTVASGHVGHRERFAPQSCAAHSRRSALTTPREAQRCRRQLEQLAAARGRASRR